MTSLAYAEWGMYNGKNRSYAEFDAYNQKYTGAYPNLYYEYDVRFRIGAINNGSFSIVATNTLKYGSASNSHYMETYKNSGVIGWYSVGHMKEKMGCRRSARFNHNCSVSGYPNLSWSGGITSSTIGLPSTSFAIQNKTQTTCEVVWNKNSDPYNIYVLYIKKPDGTWSPQLKGNNGVYKLEGLTPNTQYTYKLETWLADGSGSSLESKNIEFKTLENYPEINITGVDVKVVENGDKDNVTFTIHTTDDSHVKQWYFQVKFGPQNESSSNSFTETDLSKNLDSEVSCSVKDTLNRMSNVFVQKFHTTYTEMEVYVFNNGSWKIGYSRVNGLKNYDLCIPYIFDDGTWKIADTLKKG